MAVVKVERLWSGRSADLGADGSRSYTAQVRVTTDSTLTSELAILFAPGVPRVGKNWYVSSDGIPDPYALCTRATPRQEDNSGMHWLVDLEFSTAGLAADPGGFGGDGSADGGGGFEPGQGGAADDPTKKPPEWRVGWQEAKKPERRQLTAPLTIPTPYPYEWKGKANTNAAGDFFDPLPERPDGWPVLYYSRVFAGGPLAAAFDQVKRYANVSNADPFLGLPALSVLCRPITLEPVYYGLTMYLKKNFEFWVNPDKDGTWDPEVADVGFRAYNATAGKVTEATDPLSNQPTSVPVFLNADGTQMSRADVINPAKGPRFVYVRQVPVVNFAPLNIVL